MSLLRISAFRDWPVRRKLLLVILATTTLALSLAAAGILILDSVLFRQSLERDLWALSDIIADNSAGALAFDDAKVGAEILAALRARPHLIVACIYRDDNTILATYVRNNSQQSCPSLQMHTGYTYVPGGVSIVKPVMLAGKSIGNLVLMYDLGEVRERRLLYGAAVLAILVLSSIIGSLFSSRLRDRVSVPIVSLANTALSVTQTGDYTLRAEKLTGDETGILVDAFNDMLGRVQSRDEELRNLLRAREETNRQLVRLNEDLERFAFVASHDLREPLRMVSVYTQLLQRRSLIVPGPQTEEVLANIMNGTRRMQELLDDLRAYAELGGAEEFRSTVDLNAVFARAVRNLAMSISAARAEVTTDNLPSIAGYEGHFVPLFQNLIANAVKYRSNQVPRIHVGFSHVADLLQFYVLDNGIGIAPEFHGSIFVPFKRLHGPEIPGSGLGLSICKRVVERYDGRIWVESNVGEGAKFHFAFPDHLLVRASAEKATI